MRQNNSALTRSFLALFIANAINGILLPLGNSILSALIGKYIGKTELAVFGMVLPMIMLATSVNSLFTMGLIPVAARHIGNKQEDKASSVFSISLITTLVISVVMTCIPLFFAPWIADMLTSKTAEDAEQIRQLCVICLRMLSCTIVLTTVDAILTSALLIDNGKMLVTVGSIAMILSRLGFALLYLLVLNGGLAGTVAAFPVSLVVKILILLLYFRRKQRVFHFTLQGEKVKELKEVILCGLPQAIQIFTTFAKSITFNKLLLDTIGTSAVAAFTISGSFDQLLTGFSISAMTTTAALCGMLYNEEQQATLKDLLKTALIVSGITITIVGAPLLLFAEPAAWLFLEGGEGEVLPMAAWFIRCTVIMLIMHTLCSVMSGIYIGLRRYMVNYITELLRNLVFLLAVMIPGVLLAKETGFGLGLAGNNVLALITVFVVIPLLFPKMLPLDGTPAAALPPGSAERSDDGGDV
ncbi:MAG: hypothetical protein K5695_12065 [Oscillospiraceae bacterium]|nr:hypothetical protein [Oscillospiraceae bacterium]